MSDEREFASEEDSVPFSEEAGDRETEPADPDADALSDAEASDTASAAGSVEADQVDGMGHTVAGSIGSQVNQNQYYQQQTYNQEQNQYNVGLDEKAARAVLYGRIRKLDVKFLDTVPLDQLLKLSETTVVREEECHQLADWLSRQRLLLIEGREALGKGSLALKVVALLSARDGDIACAQRCRDSINRHMSVDLLSLFGSKDQCERSVVVLENVFREANEDLLRWVRRMDAVALSTLREQLDRSKSYLILTFDSAHRPSLHPQLTDWVKTVQGPTCEQLYCYFADRCREVIERHPREKVDLAIALEALLLENGAKRVVDCLETPPRIERFIEEWLVKVLRDESLSLDTALRQAERLDRWLLEEQAKEIQALASAMALAFCHAGPRGWPVRWLHFFQVQREVSAALLEETNQQEEKLEVASFCHEPVWLQRIRAEVAPDPGGGGDMIRFVDADRAERLWAGLLGSGRFLCALLIPRLIKMATADEYYLRQHAGWALGRIGRLDPFGLFGRLFHRWSRKAEHSETLGPLVVGALMAQDTSLEKQCRHQLRLALEHGALDKVEACTLALGDLSLVDLDAAMSLLKGVVKRWLLPRLEQLETWEKSRRELETKVQRHTGDSQLRDALSSLHDEQLQEEVDSRMPGLFPPNRESRLLSACQFILVGICFDLGSREVLRRLLQWMPPGREAEMGPILALFFLRKEGIFDVLGRYPLSADVEDQQKPERWNRVLISAASAESGLRELADFLFALYLGTCEFPSRFGRALVQRWLRLLAGLTREAAKGTLHREGVTELWRLLLASPDPELRHKLTDLLEQPSFSGESAEMSRVVAAIRQLHRQPRSRWLVARAQG